MFKIKKFEITEKPWGKEILIEKTSKYAFKEIWMKKGTRCSLQSHRKKMETIVVISGEIELETVNAKGKSTFEVFKKNQAYTIPPKQIHRVKVLKNCRLFEVSTPELHDVIRHQDDYNRTSK